MSQASCSVWLGMFFGGLALSAFFVWLDCRSIAVFQADFRCHGTPNFSIIFTIAAIALTLVALPSALRAWIIARYSD